MAGDKRAWDILPDGHALCPARPWVCDMAVDRAVPRKGKGRFAGVLFVLRTPRAKGVVSPKVAVP